MPIIKFKSELIITFLTNQISTFVYNMDLPHYVILSLLVN